MWNKIHNLMFFTCKSEASKKAHANMVLRLGDKAFWMAFVILGGSILTVNEISDAKFCLTILGATTFTLLGFGFTKVGMAKLDKLGKQSSKVYRIRLMRNLKGNRHPSDSRFAPRRFPRK